MAAIVLCDTEMDIKKSKNTAFEKFKNNLMKASNNVDKYDEATKEWLLFDSYTSEDKCTCLCEHNIKKVSFYINKYNSNIICCGTTCSKKFNLGVNYIKNNILHKILNIKKIYNKNMKITNIKEYLDYAKDELNIFLNNEIEKSSVTKLIELLDNIIEIKNLYELSFFDEIIQNIKNKIATSLEEYIKEYIRTKFDTLEILPINIHHFIFKYNIVDPLNKNNVYKIIIDEMNNYIDNCITNYSGYVAPDVCKKIDLMINNFNKKQLRLPKYFINCLIHCSTKLNNKIQTIQAINAADAQIRYEYVQNHIKRAHENGYTSKYEKNR